MKIENYPLALTAERSVIFVNSFGGIEGTKTIGLSLRDWEMKWR